jgi:hypothetical protein
MSNMAVLEEKAKKVVAKQKPASKPVPPIPGAPIVDLAGASLGSQGSFDAVQNAINYLTDKAKSKQAFTDDEKHFLVELYEAFWWGGKALGMPEAAELANHYVHGEGKVLKINSDVYSKAVVVKDTMNAMKLHIKGNLGPKKPTIGVLRSSDIGFRRSKMFRTLSMGRNEDVQGKVKVGGVLVAENNNKRLFKADHQFYLQAQWRVNNNYLSITWRVESIYDFEPFGTGKTGSFYTNLPLLSGKTIKLPDGLSNYMVNLGVAKVFNYGSDWYENQSL